MTEPIKTFYGHNIVGVDRVTGFNRDVTLIMIEVSNEILERVLTPAQLEQLARHPRQILPPSLQMSEQLSKSGELSPE